MFLMFIELMVEKDGEMTHDVRDGRVVDLLCFRDERVNQG